MSTIFLDDANIAPPEQTTNGRQSAQSSLSIFAAVSDSLDADLFIFSGNINRGLVRPFVDSVQTAARRENAVLIICTSGGDADAAYIIARLLKSHYKKFILFVFGHCKSAGTLLALGADEIVMSDRGELGPLDVQVIKSDELLFRSSGLDLSQAFESLAERAYEIFESHFIRTILRGGGAITTKTAADIATDLAVGLLSPITAQIDPLRVGEMERAINIAQEYGERLNNDRTKVDRLIKDYPSHSFVIDYTEACSLFGNVRQPNETEATLESHLRDLEISTGRTSITRPNEKGLVGYINPRVEAQNESQNQDAQEHAQSRPTEPASHEPRSEPESPSHATPDRQGVRAAQAASSTSGPDGQG